VDRLIKKLPPPEKVVQADPASRDPLAKKIVDSIKAMNLGNAYTMSRQLAARYPKSAGAHSLHGQLALIMRRYPEASDAFHKAVAIQPNYAFAYVGLALSEASQNHVNAAMSDFQQVTRLQPAADIGWIGLSACAEKLGRKGDSLQYARHATAVAPSSFAAWFQLSRAEGISGNRQASANALARANQLRRKAGKSNRR
jgi:tetratricopeptide (TPR) repeat protein